MGSLWVGVTIGTLIGVFFGLVFGRGVPGKIADFCFGKKTSMAADEFEKERLLDEMGELLAQMKAQPPFDPTRPPTPTGNPEKDRLLLEAWTLACKLLRLLQAIPALPDKLACVVLAQVDQISARTEELDRALKAIGEGPQWGHPGRERQVMTLFLLSTHHSQRTARSW